MKRGCVEILLWKSQKNDSTTIAFVLCAFSELKVNVCVCAFVLSLTILNWKIWSACFYQRTIYRRLWKVSVNDFENKFRLLLYQKISRKPNAIDETI